MSKKQQKKPLAEPHWQFRPQSRHGRYVIKERLRGTYTNYNFRLVRNISPFKDQPLNQQVIGRMFGDFHYYSGHAPEKVSESNAVKQRKVYWDKRMNRYGGKYNHGTSRVSERGLNSWL